MTPKEEKLLLQEMFKCVININTETDSCVIVTILEHAVDFLNIPVNFV